MIDLDAFNSELLDTDAFAQAATYVRQGFPSVEIPVIFDSEYSVSEGIGEPGIGLASPQALCRTADVENASRDDTLAVGGTTYHIQEVRPDGTGITTLILSRDP